MAAAALILLTACSPGPARRSAPTRPRRVPGLPRPAAGLSPQRAPSLPPGGLEPGHLKDPGRRQLGGDDRLHQPQRQATTSTPTSARPSNTASPYSVVGTGQPQASDRVHRLRREATGRSRSPPTRRSRAATEATTTVMCSRSTETPASSTSSTALSRKATAGAPTPGPGGTCARRPTSQRLDLRRRRRPADLPGLVRYDEVASGRVDHAIRVTFGSTRHAWIHPAVPLRRRHRLCRRPRPWATRLRLKAGYEAEGLQRRLQGDRTALKHYGMIVADNGSDWYFSGTSDSRWDDENLNQLKRIPGSAFQVVRSGPARTSAERRLSSFGPGDGGSRLRAGRSVHRPPFPPPGRRCYR